MSSLLSFQYYRQISPFTQTRANRTTGAKGSNFFGRNNRLQITDDHMERIRLQVSADNKEHIASNR